VLADRGVCLIDEFDKMSDQDRTSIHEAMEQQSISISKAGIVTTLQARSTIIAAANPLHGRYDSSQSFADNVYLTAPILSRFDLCCVVKDTVDPVTDELLATFVVNSHIKSHPNNKDQGTEEEEEDVSNPDLIPQELLRKYIMHAKRIEPKLHDIQGGKIEKVYTEMRAQSLSGHLITVRHIESMIRLSEAHARMHLREFVTSEDIDMAIRVMLESFISSQKYEVERAMRKSFAKYISYKKDHNELLFFILQSCIREVSQLLQLRSSNSSEPDAIDVEMDDFESRARELDIHDLHPFYNSDIFRNNNFHLDAQRRLITKVF